MRHIFLISALALFSGSAFADYFGCMLKVNGQDWVDAEAEYRGRSVSVTVADFQCDAVIDQNIVVTTTLTSLTSDQSAQASARAKSKAELWTVNSQGDGTDYASCECGLR